MTEIPSQGAAVVWVDGNAPRALVELRIRNRIIEYLEIAASLEEQEDYQRNVSWVPVPNEVICMWEDVDGEGRHGERGAPLYTDEEVTALRAFNTVWNEVCEATPDPLPPLAEIAPTPPWQRLMEAAAKALAVMERRGRLPEEDWPLYRTEPAADTRDGA